MPNLELELEVKRRILQVRDKRENLASNFELTLRVVAERGSQFRVKAAVFAVILFKLIL